MTGGSEKTVGGRRFAPIKMKATSSLTEDDDTEFL